MEWSTLHFIFVLFTWLVNFCMPSGLDLRETASPGEKSSLGHDPLGLSNAAIPIRASASSLDPLT